MIKWFDADKFLPGRETNEILVRCIIDKVINDQYYYIAIYDCGNWIHQDRRTHVENKSVSVTHWAHINEPFE